ncbi:MAG: type II toxin-antitoxin system VapC family toxin [Micrococcales bacterium]|nr:type II toxin-antitoxin system VapC family toxin [Micrococcales bacterium]
MGGYLIDTNVLSELTKPRPAPSVVAWLVDTDPDDCFLSVLTVGELCDGARRNRQRGNVTRAERLERWIAETETAYGEHVLPVTSAVAHAWADLTAERTLPVVDALIAATAAVHGLTVATRNERDYVDSGVPVLNPFS